MLVWYTRGHGSRRCDEHGESMRLTAGLSLRRDAIRTYMFSAVIALLALLVYVKNFRYAGVIGIQDTEPNQLLPITLIREGNFDLNEFIEPNGDLPYGAMRVGDHIVSNYPIVPGLLNVPVYVIANAAGVDLYAKRFELSLITASIIAALSVAVMYLILARLCRKPTTPILITLIFAFGTCVWSVASQGLWQHGPSVLMINLAVWLLLTEDEQRVPWAGLLMGLTLWNRPSNIAIALPITLYVWRQHRASTLKYVLLGALPLALMAWYSAAYLGSIFALGQTQDANLFSGDMVQGFFGLLISPSRGLFVFTPLFLFSAIALTTTLFDRKARSIYRYLAVSVILLIALYSKWYQWWGGASFGYRLLIEAVPMLTIFLAVWWESPIGQRRVSQLLFALGAVASIYVSFLGAYYYPSGFNFLPGHINLQPWRLWDWGDSELTRLTQGLLQRLDGR